MINSFAIESAVVQVTASYYETSPPTHENIASVVMHMCSNSSVGVHGPVAQRKSKKHHFAEDMHCLGLDKKVDTLL